MKRSLPKMIKALSLLPALAAVAVLNVDWTRQGHIHLGSFGVIQHHHSHTGDHRHSHPDGHSHSHDGAPSHSHTTAERVDEDGSPDSDKNGSHNGSHKGSHNSSHNGSEFPEPQGGSERYLTSSLVLASEISPPISAGFSPSKTLWTLPWVEDRPTFETRHRPSAPRGPPGAA